MLDHLTNRSAAAVPIAPVAQKDFKAWVAGKRAFLRKWASDAGFAAKPGSFLLVPGRDGELAQVLLGVESGPDIWSYGNLPRSLPRRTYRLDGRLDGAAASRAALGWALGCYGFDRYKNQQPRARLVWPDGCDRVGVERTAKAVCLIRDLINTPSEEMGPAHLSDTARSIAKEFGAKFKVIVGDGLLKANYPMIHAVGRASSRPPRLIDISWGKRGPLIALVGKGVCFDSGGLDLKTASGMQLMKKDMAGGAHMLGLAQMIMAANLPVRLRVLVPAVENSVSGNAYRPLDIIKTRKGLTVEIGNTDAEGRLILCEALTEACAGKPDLLVDCATLTGAARVALGTDLPALFSNDDATAEALLRHGREQGDSLWRLPLHKPYRSMLDSKVAHINNASDSGYAGAITAALFLNEFVEPGVAWAHIDMMAWNTKARPGRPEGGEAMAVRALFAMIAERAAAGAG